MGAGPAPAGLGPGAALPGAAAPGGWAAAAAARGLAGWGPGGWAGVAARSLEASRSLRNRGLAVIKSWREPTPTLAALALAAWPSWSSATRASSSKARSTAAARQAGCMSPRSSPAQQTQHPRSRWQWNQGTTNGGNPMGEALQSPRQHAKLRSYTNTEDIQPRPAAMRALLPHNLGSVCQVLNCDPESPTCPKATIVFLPSLNFIPCYIECLLCRSQAGSLQSLQQVMTRSV